MKRLKEMLEKHEKIACLLATYEKDRGNCTKVVLKSGNEIVLKQSVNSVIQSIARHYNVNFDELRKKQQKLLNSTYNVPLPINESMLFIPFKTRMPKVKRDPCASYINYYEIDRLDKKNPIIYLKNSMQIDILESIPTIKKRFNQGEISAKLQTNGKGNSLYVAEDTFHHLYPATKGDIKAVATEIENLTELLKRLLTPHDKQKLSSDGVLTPPER